MTDFTHILAATDFSSGSIAALERGFLIAKAAGIRYSVIHAVDEGAVASFRRLIEGQFDLLSKSVEEQAQKRLTQVVSEASRDCGLRAELRLEHGPAWAAVSVLASESDVDLIVLGAHGSSFLSQPSVGSTVPRILHTSSKPVLVVKRPPREAYSRVLVAADFSPVSEATVRLAHAIAPGAEIILMHAFEEPIFEETLEYGDGGEQIAEQYRERAHRELQELGAAAGLSVSEFSALVVRGEAKREIIANMDKLGCDLVVVGKHGIGVIDELLLGSVANRVLTDSQNDVLIVVDEREPDLWRYVEERGAKAKLLQSHDFDISAWGAGEPGPLQKAVAGEIGEAIVAALREAFSKADACEFNFGATLTEEDIEARPTDLFMTLPFTSGEDAWDGPLLLISLENIVQEVIDRFDASGASLPNSDELMKLRDGLRMLANRINKARIRNAAKIAARVEQKSPLWVV